MNKKNLILGGILLVLVLGAWAFDGPVQDWRKKMRQEKNFFSGLDFNAINRMEIAKNGSSTVLVLGDKGWRIDGTKDFYAPSSAIELVKTALEKARDNKVELASDNQDRKGDFGTGENGIAVKLMQGDKVLFDFVQGDSGADFVSSFFSPSGQNRTYSAAANLNNAFAREEWRDLKIFSADKEKISKLRFQYPKAEFSVEKKEKPAAEGAVPESFWEGTAPYKFSVNAETIGKILDAMSGLSAVEIPAQDFAKTGLEKNLIIVQATGDGVDNTLMIGEAVDAKAEEKKYYAKRGNSDNIYLVDSATHDLLLTTIAKLK